MIFSDAHNDLPSKLLKNDNRLGINELIESDVRFQVFSVFIYPTICNPFIDALCQLRLLKKELEKHDYSLQLHVNSNDDIINKDNFRYTILIEGAEAIGEDLDNIKLFKDLGVGIIGLTWNIDNGYCGNSARSGNTGLLAKGKNLINRLNENCIAIDLSHSSRNTFFDCCEISEKPCMATHSNIYNLCPHHRNIDDVQLKLLIESNGFLGLCFYKPFIGGDGGIDDYFRHIDYCLSKGAEDILGFGSDFNGMDETSPELSGTEAFSRIAERMRKAGYSEEIIEKITHKNLLNYLQRLS